MDRSLMKRSLSSASGRPSSSSPSTSGSSGAVRRSRALPASKPPSSSSRTTAKGINVRLAKAAEKPKAKSPFVLRSATGMARFSKDGRYAAVASGTNVTVVEVPREGQQQGEDQPVFQVVRKFSAVDTVEVIEWSADSKYILCGQYKRATVQVFSLEDRKWTARITEGVAGLVYCTFAPDARHVLTIADFQLHLSVWSLCDPTKEVCFVNPKLSGAQGCKFSHDGQFLAVAHRKECKDSIGIYATGRGGWANLSKFLVRSVDLEEIAWGGPNNECIVIRDTPMEYGLLVYSTSNGELIARYNAYENALGIKSMAVSPCGSFTAVGSFDQMCRVLSNVTWRPILECAHPNSVHNGKVTVIESPKEDLTKSQAPDSESVNMNTDENENTVNAGSNAHRFAVLKLDPRDKKPLPRSGIGSVSWSVDSQYFFTRDDQKPFVLWVWSTTAMEPITILQFPSKIFTAKWDPSRPRIAIATGEPHVYLWSPEYLGNPKLPTVVAWTNNEPVLDEDKEDVLGVRWNPNADSLLLVSKTTSAFSFPQEDNNK